MEQKEIPQDETKLILANNYLSEKINQGREDMKNGKGVSISIDDIWDDEPNSNNSPISNL
jgi:hypothetical protein